MAHAQRKLIYRGPGDDLHHVRHDGDRFLIPDRLYQLLRLRQSESGGAGEPIECAYTERVRGTLALALYADCDSVHYLGEIYPL